MKYFSEFSQKLTRFLLISTNLFIEFQGSSFNGFWDILLTRENAQIYKGPLLMKYFFFRINSKVDQVIYSSLSIISPSVKALASTVFEIFCWQGKNAQNYKGP